MSRHVRYLISWWTLVTNVTVIVCGLTAKKPGSAPCPTVVIEYGTILYCFMLIVKWASLVRGSWQLRRIWSFVDLWVENSPISSDKRLVTSVFIINISLLVLKVQRDWTYNETFAVNTTTTMFVCRRRRSLWKHTSPMEHTKVALTSGNGVSVSHPTDPVDIRRQQYQTPGTHALLLHSASSSLLLILGALMSGEKWNKMSVKDTHNTCRLRRLYSLFANDWLLTVLAKQGLF